MTRRLLAFLAILSVTGAAIADPKVLSMRDRADTLDMLLKDRVETVLPALMRKTGIDMWIIISREYNEDPVIKTFLPARWHAARRTTVLMITDPGDGQPLETLSVSRYAAGEIFAGAWNKEEDGEQWAHLGKLIAERDPDRIGLNFSETWGHADGIAHTEYELFRAALPERLHLSLIHI